MIGHGSDITIEKDSLTGNRLDRLGGDECLKAEKLVRRLWPR